MIATTTTFWKAFFDRKEKNHKKARSDIAVFDREKIVMSEFIIAEVVSWLLSKGKREHSAWFLDLVQNTANTRIYVFSKEELASVLAISAKEGLPLDSASLEYLKRSLNCDITGY